MAQKEKRACGEDWKQRLGAMRMPMWSGPANQQI